MADIFFSESSEAPVPPEEVRIRAFSAKPYPDGRRIEINMSVTPFQKKPNYEIKIVNGEDIEVAELNVVEAVQASMDFTVHLREKETGGTYKAVMRVFYADLDSHAEENSDSAGEILDKAGQTVDTRAIEFIIE
jgi:hypothetical protein